MKLAHTLLGHSRTTHHSPLTTHRRSAFTLVEMLVVIGIIVALMALAVLVVPRVQERSKAARGADQLQGWLLIAKQTALRDKVPRGIRLVIEPDPDGGTDHCHDLQYLEQPPDFSGGFLISAGSPIPPYQVTLKGVDGWGGYGNTPGEWDLWPIQPDDFLEVYPGQNNPLHRIGAAPPAGPPSPPPPSQWVASNGTDTVLTLASMVPAAQTSQYRIIRAPRPIAGEADLHLPKDIAIDLTRSYGLQAPAAGSPWQRQDIMFAPSGAVVGPLAKTGKIILWVRDVSQDTIGGSGDTLITIYTRTGLIAAHPVDMTNYGTPAWNPYSYTQDGRSSGM